MEEKYINFLKKYDLYREDIFEYMKDKTKYIDYRLYQEHCTIINDDFVKDLSKIGRPIDKMVIVDNMFQNYRLQKDNGINIKPFCGNLNKETNTLNTLGDVLVKIRNDAEETNDIRISLNKVKKLLYPDVVDKLENMDNM